MHVCKRVMSCIPIRIALPCLLDLSTLWALSSECFFSRGLWLCTGWDAWILKVLSSQRSHPNIRESLPELLNLWELLCEHKLKLMLICIYLWDCKLWLTPVNILCSSICCRISLCLNACVRISRYLSGTSRLHCLQTQASHVKFTGFQCFPLLQYPSSKLVCL